MPVRFDTALDGFVIEPDDCPDCEQPLYHSGCVAPGCNGLACEDCGTGCDLEFSPAGEGECASALADEPEADRQARIDVERAAFGLSPIGSGVDPGGASR